MNFELGIWSWLSKAMGVLIAAAILVLIVEKYLPLIQQNERMRREIDRLDAEQKKQEQISRELRNEIDALRNDPETVTRLVREKLGYAKTNETVLHFESTNADAVR
ncbi:MAG: septum formation initiator family protein [Verrucomicrobiota bacterium]